MQSHPSRGGNERTRSSRPALTLASSRPTCIHDTEKEKDGGERRREGRRERGGKELEREEEDGREGESNFCVLPKLQEILKQTPQLALRSGLPLRVTCCCLCLSFPLGFVLLPEGVIQPEAKEVISPECFIKDTRSKKAYVPLFSSAWGFALIVLKLLGCRTGR